MGSPNTLGLLFEISADPSKAEAALAQFTEQNAASAAGIKQSWSDMVAEQMAGTGFVQDAWAKNAEAARAYGGAVQEVVAPTTELAATTRLTEEEMQRNRAAVQANIAAYREQAAAAEETAVASQTFGQQLRANLGDMQALRRAMYAVFMPAMFGYIIPELGRIFDLIREGALELGGYDTAYQQLMADAIKANQAEENSWKTLNAAQQGALNALKDVNEQQVERLKLLLGNAKAEQAQAHQTTVNLQGQLDAYRATATALRSHSLLLAAATAGQATLYQYLTAMIYERVKGVKDLQAAIDQQLKNEKDAGQTVLTIQGQLQAALNKTGDAADKGADRWRKHVEQIEHAHQVLPQFILDLEKLQATWQKDSTLVAAKDFLALNASANMLHFSIPKLTGDITALQKALPQLQPPDFLTSKGAQRLWEQFNRMGLEEDRYAGRAQRDAVQVALAHKHATDAATQHLVSEAKALSTLTGDWRIYSQAVERANQIVKQSQQDANSAMKQSLLGTAQSLAGMLGLEKEFVIAEAAFKIPMYIAEGLAALARHDGWAAANYFASAAEWGVAAGAAVKSLMSGSGAPGAGAPAAGASTATAATASSAAASGQHSMTSIFVEGGFDPKKLYAGQVILDIAKALNKAIANGSTSIIIRTPVISRS
jgi:hypothetical protein